MGVNMKVIILDSRDLTCNKLRHSYCEVRHRWDCCGQGDYLPSGFLWHGGNLAVFQLPLKLSHALPRHCLALIAPGTDRREILREHMYTQVY